MSDPHDLDPLEADLAALLDRERSAGAPREALARVRVRLAQSVALGGAGAKGSGVESGAARGGRVLGRLPQGPIAVAFLAGGLVGAGALALLRPAPHERVVYVDRPVAAAPAPVVEVPAPPSSAVPVPAEPITVPAGSAPPLPPSSSGGVARRPTHSESPAPSSLRAERELLDRARKALSTGDASGALAILGQHESAFAQPLLAEEREALAVQALVIGGRYEDARARAARFRAAWPGSLFLPAVDASLASIP